MRRQHVQHYEPNCTFHCRHSSSPQSHHGAYHSWGGRCMDANKRFSLAHHNNDDDDDNDDDERTPNDQLPANDRWLVRWSLVHTPFKQPQTINRMNE